MNYIYQWDILESEVNNSDSSFPDTIKRVKFALTTIDVSSEGNETTFRMDDVYLPNPTEKAFKPFNELTYADFVDFITKTIGEQKIENLKQEMIEEINSRYARKAQQNKLKLPWDEANIIVDKDLPKFNNESEYLESLKSNA